MNARTQYFAAAVKLHSAKQLLERVISNVEIHCVSPSQELMAACVMELVGAMAIAHAEQVRSPMSHPQVPCERGCGHISEHHICSLAECEL